MEAEGKQSHSWWFDSHNNPSHSPWLVSTLSELDEKVKAMLKLMEGDADSFMKRVDMYYRVRPELMTLVDDLYRSHRSLVERYDRLRARNSSDQISVSSYESEVVDPEGEFRSEDEVNVTSVDAEHGIESNNALEMMMEEIERLKEENRKLRSELGAKDEDGREFLRDLSLTNRSKFLGFFDFKKLEGILWIKFFGGHF